MQKDATTVPADADGKRQHMVEVLNFVDAGTSILLSAQAHADFHAETALEAVVHFLRQQGLPAMLTFDNDPRLRSAVRADATFPRPCAAFCCAWASCPM